MTDMVHACLAGKVRLWSDSLPRLLPGTKSHSPVEADSSSSPWQAHSFQSPVHIWHQITASPALHLPKSFQALHNGASAAWTAATPDAADYSKVRGVVRLTEGVVARVQQLGRGMVARVPGLVPTGQDSVEAKEADAQVRGAVPGPEASQS